MPKTTVSEGNVDSSIEAALRPPHVSRLKAAAAKAIGREVHAVVADWHKVAKNLHTHPPAPSPHLPRHLNIR